MKLRTLAIVATFATAGFATANAEAALPGQICQVKGGVADDPRGWIVYPDSGLVWYVKFPGIVRILGYDGPDNYTVRQNGDDPSNYGAMSRVAINQSTCS